MAPGDGGVALEPAQLFLGVEAGVLLDALNGGVAVHSAVEECKQFFVTHGVERVEMAKVKDAAGFFFESLLNHVVDSAVDAVEEQFPLHVETHLDDVERALLCLAGSQGGVGHASLTAHLDSMEHSAMVLLVYLGEIDRVEALKFGK